MTTLYRELATIKVTVTGRVVTATIDNPPLHLITLALLQDLETFTTQAAADPDVTVVVIRSADPDIFITHNEFANLYDMQPEDLPASPDEVELNRMHHICERLRTMDKVTIAQVEGHTAGGGAAMVMACDMAFGAIGKAVFNTMSVPLGAVPGGGASQYMPRRIGRARAMELIMGGLDLDAETAERWGYINRALPAETIGAFVEQTARRIAASPPDAVRLTKEALSFAEGPIAAGLREENYRFRRLMASPESVRNIGAFLDLGGETREGETRMGDLLGEVLDQVCDLP